MQVDTQDEMILARENLEVVKLAPIKVNHNLSIDDNVVMAKEAGWEIDNPDFIRADREINFAGKPYTTKKGVVEENISIVRFIHDDQDWENDRVMAGVGKSGIAFGFTELISLIPLKDMFLEHRIRWVSAMGTHFLAYNYPYMARLDFSNQCIKLKRGEWLTRDWFGLL